MVLLLVAQLAISATPTDPDPAWFFEANEADGRLGYAMTAADVNGDGRSDLVVSAPDAGKVFTFLGGAQGLPAAPSSVSNGQKGRAMGHSLIPVGDVNGDGREDVVAIDLSYNHPNFELLAGTPSGLSPSPVWSYVCLQTLAKDAVRSLDANGDGVRDLILACRKTTVKRVRVFGQDVKLWEQTDEGLLVFHGAKDHPLALAPDDVIDQPEDASTYANLATGDFDGDGRAELLVTRSQSRTIFDRALDASPRRVKGLPYTDGTQVVVDVDRDGRADVIARSQTGFGISFGSSEGLRAPSIEVTRPMPRPVRRQIPFPLALAAGDVNGDRHVDVVAGSANDGRVDLFLGGPERVFDETDFSAQGIAAGAMNGASVVVSDFNGDGLDDVVVGAPFHSGPEKQEGRVSLYLGSRCLEPGAGPCGGPAASASALPGFAEFRAAALAALTRRDRAWFESPTVMFAPTVSNGCEPEPIAFERYFRLDDPASTFWEGLRDLLSSEPKATSEKWRVNLALLEQGEDWTTLETKKVTLASATGEVEFHWSGKRWVLTKLELEGVTPPQIPQTTDCGD